MRLYLCRPARPEELRVVRGGLRRLLRGVGAREEVMFDVLVACSEACSNAIRHPIKPRRTEFEVKATADSEDVRVMVRDFGRWRDQPSSTENSRGAVGLSLMRWLMDDVRLKRTGSGTFVRMHRRLKDERFAPRLAG